MPLRSKEDETIAVLPDAAAGMDQDVVAHEGRLDRAPRTDIAIPADPDIDADHRACADHRPGADFDVWTDHGQRIDNHAVLQMRRRIDDGGRSEARNAEPGLWTQRVTVQVARNSHKRPERLDRAQYRNMRGNFGFETRVDQARPRFGRSELIGIFQVVDKCQMHRTGLIERSHSPDLLAAPRRIDQM